MKERPFKLYEHEVQAILAGNQTQTRRVVKMTDSGAWDFKDLCWPKSGFLKHQLEKFGSLFRADKSRWIAPDKPFHGFSVCPYGQIGDQLWVRETWQPWRRTNVEYDEWEPLPVGRFEEADSIEYRATSDSLGPWKPSIHMPRKASRIQLGITNIRVERLQDISRQDAIAEGIRHSGLTINGISEGDHFYDYLMKTEDMCEWFTNPIASFQSLWHSINGPDSWTANPWVWVIEFKRVECSA